MMDLFSLGDLYVSDFLAPGEEPRCAPVELKLQMDEETGAVRLETPTDPSFMYGKYWYRSGISDTMKVELKDVVDSILKVKKSGIDTWLDIASNDGTLLSYVPKDVWRVGIDPVDDTFKVEAEKHADVIIQDFFSADAFHTPGHHGLPGSIRGGADVVTCIAMFYDLDNPVPFLEDVHSIMKDDGLFVLQMSYTPLMMEQTAFDNICHEHIYYYTAATMTHLLETNGFRVVDIQLNDVNGGSFRVYAMKRFAEDSGFGSQPYRDVCTLRVNSLLSHEELCGYNEQRTWKTFHRNIEKLKRETVDFLREAKAQGKTTWGYGASTKGNTLLQYFGIDSTLIDGIAERSPAKYGLRTIGTNIPIHSEDDMRAANPDYLLVLPWHFINEFVQREQDFLDRGGKFIVPCPEFKVIGK